VRTSTASAALGEYDGSLSGPIAERWRGLVAQGHGHLDISAARHRTDALQARRPETFG